MFMYVWLLVIFLTNAGFIVLAHRDTMPQFKMDTPIILTLSNLSLFHTLIAEHQAGNIKSHPFMSFGIMQLNSTTDLMLSGQMLYTLPNRGMDGSTHLPFQGHTSHQHIHWGCCSTLWLPASHCCCMWSGIPSCQQPGYLISGAFGDMTSCSRTLDASFPSFHSCWMILEK